MTGLYIHIPFCVHKCSYCDFVSYVCDAAVREEYVQSLICEIRMAGEIYRDRVISTVFLGGGTPCILFPSQTERIMCALHDSFNIGVDAEITVECNPGAVDFEKLSAYSECGINRLSFGLQSASERLLKEISRIHTFSDFSESIEYAKQAGFSNINADIMYGLPSQSISELEETISAVCDMNLAHVSAYSLIVEENTPLFSSLMRGSITLPDEDTEYEMHTLCRKRLESAGYRRYEISNYAKRDMECRHNLIYWNADEYIGLGANAHSAVWESGVWTRYKNFSSIGEYMSAVREGSLPTECRESLAGYDAQAEYVMLGLRKTDGFLLSGFEDRFSEKFDAVFGERLARVDKSLYVKNERFYLTDKGLDLQNIILCELL